MGQGQSSNGKKEDVSMYPKDIQRDHQKLKALREKLAILKAEGKANRKIRKKEIKMLEKEKMQAHVTLMKLGKHAQRHFSFWEYVRIVRSTFQSPAAPKALQGSSTTLGSEKSTATSTSTAMVRQSDAVQYTIFAFYEAYLLKKLHVAMMLKTQKKLHAKGWNDMTMFLYHELPKIRTSFEKAEAKLLNQQQDHGGERAQVEELYKAHIENQKRLMEALQEGVEGKARSGPEGGQYSFKKKASESMDSSEEFSSGSFRAASGSSRTRPARSSLNGPAFESGSSKNEEYQAPWMKSSRNKLAKTAQKARGPTEEEQKAEEARIAAEKKAAQEAEAARIKAEKEAEEARIAAEKKAARIKAEKDAEEARIAAEKKAAQEAEAARIKAEKEAEEARIAAEKKAVQEAEAARIKAEKDAEEARIAAEKKAAQEAEAAKEEASKEEPTSVITPEETETTEKSSIAEEEEEPSSELSTKKKKKKKNKLPTGMPQEIVTSDEEISLDGDGPSSEFDPGTKKKKKKKKKKKIGTGTDSDGEDLLSDGAAGVVKKKKKKKKKPVSSNSSVVSELSNGSSLPN